MKNEKPQNLKIMRGIEIFLKYGGEQDDFGKQRKTKPENLKPGHEKILKQLGWYWNEENHCWCYPKTTPKRKYECKVTNIKEVSSTDSKPMGGGTMEKNK